MSLQMPVGAESVDESADLRLLEAVDDPDPGGLSSRQRVAAVAEREALKEGAPRWIDGIGILLPRFKRRLDDGGIGVGRHVEEVHGKLERARETGKLWGIFGGRFIKNERRLTQHEIPRDSSLGCS